MPFCSKCGQDLARGAKFCYNCGESVDFNGRDNSTEATDSNSRIVFDGKVHKCIRCGEVLDSFVANCPACGYELRGVSNSSTVKEFVAKLEQIEAGREQKKRGLFGKSLTKTDEQKISLIRSFAIPNTKEDLYEFFILSASNIDVDAYDDDGQEFKNRVRKAVSDAWKAKLEQTYRKAKVLFKNDPKLFEIEITYKETLKSIKKARYRSWKIVGIVWGILIAFFLIMFLIVVPLVNNNIQNNMEEIVTKIETALENEEYKLALMYADSLKPGSGSTTINKDWEIKREYWIDKVIDEAAENGVILERPADKPVEKDETSAENTDISSGNKTETSPNKKQTNIGAFDAETVVKQLKVTEHCGETYGHYFPVLIIENPTTYNLSLSVDIKFYDKSGKLVGAKSDEVYAFEKGTKTIMQFSVDEEFDRMEYEFTVEEEDYYNCVISSLKIESVSAKDKEILSVTNIGTQAAEFVEGFALFFKNGKLIGTDWTYFTDDDSELKPDKTITKELTAYGEDYDAVEFYFTGRAEK